MPYLPDRIIFKSVFTLTVKEKKKGRSIRTENLVTVSVWKIVPNAIQIPVKCKMLYFF